MRNKEMMKKAEFIIMAGIPFGTGNLGNLECVLEKAEGGNPVIIVDNLDVSERDYTGGKAAELYRRLLESGVRRVNSAWEAIQLLKGGADNVI